MRVVTCRVKEKKIVKNRGEGMRVVACRVKDTAKRDHIESQLRSYWNEYVVECIEPKDLVHGVTKVLIRSISTKSRGRNILREIEDVENPNFDEVIEDILKLESVEARLLRYVLNPRGEWNELMESNLYLSHLVTEE